MIPNCALHSGANFAKVVLYVLSNSHSAPLLRVVSSRKANKGVTLVVKFPGNRKWRAGKVPVERPASLCSRLTPHQYGWECSVLINNSHSGLCVSQVIH